MFRVAWSALPWALRCYARHLPLVLGLSAIPAAQRFLLMSPDSPLVGPVAVFSEAIVLVSRLLLVGLLLRIAVREVIDQPGDRARRGWQAFTDGIDPRLGEFLIQFLPLLGAFLIFELVPDALIASTVPEDRQATATSILFAVKNLTVIAWAMAWLVGVARGYMLLGLDRRDAVRDTPTVAT